MSWVATAIVGGAVIGAVGSSIAGNQQAGAQRQAANTQAGMFNTIVGQEQPFVKAGGSAATTLAELLGTGYGGKKGNVPGTANLPYGYLTERFAPTQAQLNAYPGYEFALQTGGQAIRNADTPGVGALSGPALKDLMSFNVGTANQFYGQYFNQFQTQQNNIFNRLSALAGIGQAAAGNEAAAGTQLGTGIGQAQAGAGASQAGGVVGATNALGSIPLSYLLASNSGLGGGGEDLSPAQLTEAYAAGAGV